MRIEKVHTTGKNARLTIAKSRAWGARLLSEFGNTYIAFKTKATAIPMIYAIATDQEKVSQIFKIYRAAQCSPAEVVPTNKNLKNCRVKKCLIITQ
nr:hypothetical protein [Hellea balneolensis]